jgi:hypothetical protein
MSEADILNAVKQKNYHANIPMEEHGVLRM